MRILSKMPFSRSFSLRVSRVRVACGTLSMWLAIAVTYDFSAIGHCGGNSVIRYGDDPGTGSDICLAERTGILPSKAGRAFKRFLLEYVEQGRFQT